MTNEEWQQAYRQGYRDGREDAEKNKNYQNFPQVYYGGATPAPKPSGAYSTTMGTPTDGLSYSLNERQEAFVTGMSVQDIGC